ncbi:MAG: hypothetical protein ACPGJV_02050 [Bacteriovoracaceae bacterium]
MIIKNSEQSPRARQKRILELFKIKKEIKTSDVVGALPEVSRRTLERDLENLCKDNQIIAIGEKKARVYRLK